MLKKIFLWTLLGTLSLILIIFLIFVLANTGDQKIRPEVNQELNWRPPTQWQESNAFVLLRGLDAKSSSDAYAIGIERINSEVMRYQQGHMFEIDAATSQGVDEENPNLKLLKDERCQYDREKNCLQFYLSRDRETLDRAIALNRDLIDRFSSMKRSTRYLEVIPPHMNADFPPYSSVVVAFEVERMKAIRKIANGDFYDGLRDYLTNATFAHTLYVQSKTLVSANIYLAVMERDIRVLNELLEKYPVGLHYAADIEAYLSSLKKLEVSMASALEFERQFNLQMVKSIVDQKASENFFEEKLALVLTRKNASMNFVYDWTSMNVQLAKQSAHSYLDFYQEMEKRRDAMLGVGYESIYLRDPLVKILMNVARDSYLRYIERVYDLEGAVNLQRLSLAIRLKHMPNSEVPAFIEATVSQFPNPYTSKAMQWDATNAALIFEAKLESNIRFQKAKTIRLSLQ